MKAILEECEEMFKVYLESPLGDEEKKYISVNFWILAGNGKQRPGLKVVINVALITELNSTNFLINGEGKS